MITGMLLRLTDNPTLTVAQTVQALREGAEQGGLCWVPILGQTPAERRHEDYPFFLVAADKKIHLVLEIHELRRGTATGKEICGTADEADVAAAFIDVSAEAWLKVAIASDLTALGTRFEESPPLGQGINYLRLDENRRTWRRVARPSISVRATARSVPARSPSNGSALKLPPKLDVDRRVRVLGIDLTASAAKASAACILDVDGSGTVTCTAPSPLMTDDDIVRLAESEQWDCVALDGPRAEPKGWTGFVARLDSVDAGVRSRPCEREVHVKIGSIFFFSPRARIGVREWLSRSTRLFARLTGLGSRLIEVFPHATFVALVSGIERRRPNPLRPKDTPGGLADREAILGALLGQFSTAKLGQGNAETHDVADAAAAAATALGHVVGHTVALGDPMNGGQIIVPNLIAPESSLTH